MSNGLAPFPGSLSSSKFGTYSSFRSSSSSGSSWGEVQQLWVFIGAEFTRTSASLCSASSRLGKTALAHSDFKRASVFILSSGRFWSNLWFRVIYSSSLKSSPFAIRLSRHFSLLATPFLFFKIRVVFCISFSTSVADISIFNLPILVFCRCKSSNPLCIAFLLFPNASDIWGGHLILTPILIACMKSSGFFTSLLCLENSANGSSSCMESYFPSISVTKTRWSTAALQ